VSVNGAVSSGRRVVVTGLGLVTPLGIGWRETWGAALEGRSGAGPITRFDAAGYGCRIACEVDGFDPRDFMEHRAARRMDRVSQLAVAAGRLALEDAGLLGTPDLEEAGAIIATGNGGSETFEQAHRTLLERGPGRVSPFALPAIIVNMSAGQVSMELGLRGPLSCPVTACASGNHGIGDAAAAIRAGEADVMLAGGSEAGVTPFCMAGLDATRALSRRNDEPARASRPFDRDRDGFVAAEGAGVLVLESWEHAVARGAEPICEFRGYGQTGDAHHLTEPDPSGRSQIAAIRMALRAGGLSPEDIDYVNAHGTSTLAGDAVEVGAVRKALGEDVAGRVAISSTKSMHGHAMGAAGGIEGALTALAIRDGVIPPTINLEHLDPGCEGIDHVRGDARRTPVRAAFSSSFGFGGHNAVIAMSQVRP
jgi:3-oxoacyl-[acyl-carrier-protein] synthase II